MGDSVKVAVRVRPFNDREKTLNSACCISMDGNITKITDPNDKNAKPREFTFDHSYWSHDEYKINSNGYNEPISAKYADQKKVFEDLGRGVLSNAWDGYNCALFAYGQTGSGKSYSMVGYGANKGIVPVTCEQLFEAVNKNQGNKDQEYQVTFSMLEIYNEQVRNLLDPETFKIKGGLKIREHPKLGFFVDSVTPVPVNSYEAIENKIDQGTKNRTVASTNMNATSSRAHTVVSVGFVQKTTVNGKGMTKSSTINLVDLAGSERAESTGATGSRLKEGAAINKSLTMLGNCIKALADQASGKKGVKVPFRDSKLTMMLKNALCGNSKTIMIAALSPASVNYDETLGTLRFADRAKSLKTKAKVNESPTEKLIRELREENQKLLDQLKKGGSMGGGGKYTEEEVEQMKQELMEQLKHNQSEMDDMQTDWKSKLQAQERELVSQMEEEKKKAEQKKVIPHFWNLHEDPALTAKIVHFTTEGKLRIGNRKAEPAPEIILSGLGIQAKHAEVVNKNGTVHLIPGGSGKVFLNGNEIKDKKELHHHDRVMFGTSNLFVFHHPKDFAKQQKSGKPEVPAPTYDSAQDEIAETSGIKNFFTFGDNKSKDDLLLQEDLFQMWPMVAEANGMSEEMDKKVKFEMALRSPQARGKREGRTEIWVKMKDMTTGNEFLWDRSTFIDRKFLMQEMYQNFVEGEDINVPKEDDPFVENPDNEVLIGTLHLYMWSLAHVVECEEQLQITDYKGLEKGHVTVHVYPCSDKGKDFTPDDDEFLENPTELVGKSLCFKIRIINARGLPTRFVKSFCQYKFYIDDKPVVTKEMSGTSNPDFNHEKMFKYNPVTKQFVDYLLDEPLIIEVWGRQKGPSGNNNLTTRELMAREKTIISGGNGKQADSSHYKNQQDLADIQYKAAAEAATAKRRSERAELKLMKIQKIVEKAKEDGEDTINLAELDSILKTGSRLKGVAQVLVQMEKAKKLNQGKVGSQACVLQ